MNVTLPLFGTLSAEPSSHDIAQVTTIKGGARAVDFDRSGGFSIDTISKSGTNRYAGEISYQFQNDNMTADAARAAAPRATSRIAAGSIASIGGPVLPNRLFFYGSYYRPENTRENRANRYGELPPYERDAQRRLRQGDVHAGELGAAELQLPRLRARGHERTLRVECRRRRPARAAKPSRRSASCEGSWVINSRSLLTFKYNHFVDEYAGPAGQHRQRQHQHRPRHAARHATRSTRRAS